MNHKPFKPQLFSLLGTEQQGKGIVKPINSADRAVLYDENLRSAKQTDVYIFSGNESGTQVWQPSFTYHGFRYVEILGWPCHTSSIENNKKNEKKNDDFCGLDSAR